MFLSSFFFGICLAFCFFVMVVVVKKLLTYFFTGCIKKAVRALVPFRHFALLWNKKLYRNSADSIIGYIRRKRGTTALTSTYRLF